jgi:phospholipase C
MRILPRNRTAALAALSCALMVIVQVRLPGQKGGGRQTRRRIQHLVVIVQENISFDHYFATYPYAANPPGEPEFHALPGTPSVNGLSGGLLTNNPNSFQPFRLDRSRQLICGPTPGYTAEQSAYHSGLVDRFPEFTGQISNTTPPCDFGLGRNVVMGYYDGNTLTALWNYAQHFAMSDNFFGTTFGQSAPGHVNLVSGQTHGATVVRADSNTDSVVVNGTMSGPGGAIDDCENSTGTQVVMSGRNVGDLLNARGLTWGYFSGGFAPTSRDAGGTAICGSGHSGITTIPTPDYVPNHEPFQKYPSTANPHHLPPAGIAMIGFSDQANHQYDLDDFWRAAGAGNLPAVSFIEAPSYLDGHSQASSTLDEQAFLVGTMNRLQLLPEWESTAVIITYDDSGGWYDHVMPPIVSASNSHLDALTDIGSCGSNAAGAYQGRCGYGPRLPMLLISPWARVNFVDHGITDQSSILRFIEDNWSLGRIGDGSFDERAGSILTLFDFEPRRGAAKKLFLDAVSGQPVEQSKVAL